LNGIIKIEKANGEEDEEEEEKIERR